MIGAIVYSKAFGQGIIIEKTDGYIKVKFAASEKEFPFPRAFEGFLSTEDDDVLAEVEHLRQIAIQEKARREEEARLAEVARQEENARRMARLSAGKVRIERKSSSLGIPEKRDARSALAGRSFRLKRNTRCKKTAYRN